MATALSQHEGTAAESDLRADMQLLQSLAQDATENTNAQASRAALLNNRPDQSGVISQNGDSYLHPPDPSHNVGHHHSAVTSATLAAPVPEASMITASMALNPNTASLLPVQSAPSGVPNGLPVGRPPGVGMSPGLDGRPRQARPLSSTKRAAQNRAAQRAFRQRKENHIKTLETENAEYQRQAQHWKQIESENHALRQYCHHLQSRLIDAQGEMPPPPQGLQVTGAMPVSPSTSGMVSNSSSSPTQAAAAVAPTLTPDVQAAAAAAEARIQAQQQQQQPREIQSHVGDNNAEKAEVTIEQSVGEPMVTDEGDESEEPVVDDVAQAVVS